MSIYTKYPWIFDYGVPIGLIVFMFFAVFWGIDKLMKPKR